MYTGIITDVGTVRSLARNGVTRVVLTTPYRPESIDIGASLNCNGFCVTVVAKGSDARGNWLAFDATNESRARTNVDDWREGTRVNLERSLKAGDELGGHFVSGHVDAVGEITGIREDGESLRFSFRAPAELMRFIARKGSITINGVSLTVNEVARESFGVSIIPYTHRHTNFGDAKIGDRVNLEVDMLARYVARILGEQ